MLRWDILVAITVGFISNSRHTRGQSACVGGFPNERICRGFCSDTRCVIRGGSYVREITSARIVASPSGKRQSCVCEDGWTRSSRNGPCVQQCVPTSQPNFQLPDRNMITAATTRFPYPPYGYPYPYGASRPPIPPNGTYPLPNGAAIKGDATAFEKEGKGNNQKTEKKGIPDDCPYDNEILCKYMPDRIDPSLIGKSSSIDDPENSIKDTMLANGMTVKQLSKLKPFYKLYHGVAADHYYTWVESDISTAIRMHGYDLEGIAGKIATSIKDITGQGITCPKLKPLTQFYKAGLFADPDHFYTVKKADAERAAGEGYVEEGVAGYCVEYSPGCGAIIPMHRFWNEPARDHIYVTSYKDYKALTGDVSWTYEGVECYIWPSI